MCKPRPVSGAWNSDPKKCFIPYLVECPGSCRSYTNGLNAKLMSIWRPFCFYSSLRFEGAGKMRFYAYYSLPST